MYNTNQMFNFGTTKAFRLFFLIAVFELACLSSISLKNPASEAIGQTSRLVFKDTVITQSFDNQDQSPAGAMKYLGKFKVTFYWIVRESDYNGEKNTPLYLENGKILGYFPYDFVQDFKKEACAELNDGKRISYLKKANKVRIVQEFLGFNGHTISPLKSIAVDPDVIPLGSKLYIPNLSKLTNHDGKIFAHDIGSMIKDREVDIFVGHKENTKLLTSVGIESSGLVDIYLLE